MRIHTAVENGTIPFVESDLGDILASGGAEALPPIKRGVIAHLPTNDEVVLRWRHVTKSASGLGMPATPDELVAHVGQWYENELDTLRQLGVLTLPHHTYVVEDASHPVAPLTVYTAVQKIPRPDILYYMYDNEPSRYPQNRIDCLLGLGRTVVSYYSRQIGRETTKFGICDIGCPRQYHALPLENGAIAPLLMDYDQWALPFAKEVGRSLRMIGQWVDDMPPSSERTELLQTIATATAPYRLAPIEPGKYRKVRQEFSRL